MNCSASFRAEHSGDAIPHILRGDQEDSATPLCGAQNDGLCLVGGGFLKAWVVGQKCCYTIFLNYPWLYYTFAASFRAEHSGDAIPHILRGDQEDSATPLCGAQNDGLRLVGGGFLTAAVSQRQ